MDWFAGLAAFFLPLALSLAGSGVMLRILRQRAILDHPNERSSHSTPTPRGGGLAVMLALYAAWGTIGVSGTAGPSDPWAVLVCGLPLVVVGWIDDLYDLAPSWRLLVQVVVIALLVGLFRPFSGAVFQGLLPPAWDAVATGVVWLWFVNLYNFMDGIDGITGTETACLGGGVAVVAGIAGLGGGLPLLGVALAGAGLGFLWWNRHPARLFLGDVGSVPLGLTAGWLLLELAARGQWAAALILPLYYLADATITLGRRVARGEPPWRAHRQHFYQQAIRRGVGHPAVVHAVLLADLGLVVLAIAAGAGLTAVALGGAAAVVAGLLIHLAGGRRRPAAS